MGAISGQLIYGRIVMLLTSRDVGMFHPQKTFDTVVSHQRQQGYRQSTRLVWNEKKQCHERLMAYKGDNGCQCAAAALIPPEHYIPELEDCTVKHPLLQFSLKTSGHNFELAYRLQLIHDTVSPDSWEQCWEGLAKEFKLQYAPPQAEKLSENLAALY
jgi:hypothetical protein